VELLDKAPIPQVVMAVAEMECAQEQVVALMEQQIQVEVVAVALISIPF